MRRHPVASQLVVLLGLALAQGAHAQGAPATPSAAPSPTAPGTAALAPDVLAAFRSLPADPKPESITRDSHYWVSNEYRLELFEPYVRGLGGVYVGVGTDQNYLLAAWARSEVLVLMDFDQAIPDLHKAYAVTFREAATPEDFLALWEAGSVKQVEGWLTTTFADDPDLKRIVRYFKVAQPIVKRRLTQTLRAMQKLKLKTFMDDAAQYKHIKDLYANGRVFAVRGDLTANLTMKAIGAAVKQAGLAVRVFYPSNAEQYFDFTPEYRANVAALPMDEKSVVVRTLGWGGYGMADATYHYNVQPGLIFQRWLTETKVKNAGRMLHWRKPEAEFGFSTFEQGPEAMTAPKRKATKGG